MPTRGRTYSPSTGHPEWTRCYLCAAALDAAPTRDHVPPKGFIAPRLRKAEKINLVTLPTHRACNEAYKLDEEYLRDSLAPMAQGTVAGRAIMEHIAEKWRDGKSHALAKQVLAEFTDAPGRVVLPPWLSAKRFGSQRVQRVIWKIIRGLYFIERDRVLPADGLVTWDIRSVEDGKSLKFARAYDQLHGLPRTPFPGAFDYCLLLDDAVPDSGVGSMLLWDYFTVWTFFRR